MKLRASLSCLFVSLFVSLGSSKALATNISKLDSGQSFGRIILEKPSTITITSRIGFSTCREGEIWLSHPGEVKIISSNVISEDNQKPARLLVPNYGKGLQRITLGPYQASTELILTIKPGSFCGGSYSSTDKFRTRFWHHGGNSWTIGWEDFKDHDFNDVYTDIDISPLPNFVKAVRAFSQNPVYKLPCPAGVGHKLTSYPGYSGEHKNILAHDFAMRTGDLIVASEQGLILWIEDSFGSGSCNSTLRSSTNVVVIQTKEGVNQTYVHLQKGSISEFGLKVGDHVSQGQPIARAGNSGYACSDRGDGTHLHIEWQHHCYELDDVSKRRGTVGKPTLSWSCTGFPPDAPYQFTIDGKLDKVNNLNKNYISDNSP